MAQLFPIQAQKSILFSGNRRGKIFFKKKQTKEYKKSKKTKEEKRISQENRLKQKISHHPHFRKQEYFFQPHPWIQNKDF